MSDKKRETDALAIAGIGFFLWLMFGFLICSSPSRLVPSWQLFFVVVGCILFAISVGLVIHLCFKSFRRSRKIATKLFVVVVLTGVISILLRGFSLHLLSFLARGQSLFCNSGNVEEKINFPDYNKTIYIFENCSLMSSFDTIYVQESWQPSLKKLALLPAILREVRVSIVLKSCHRATC